MTFDLGIRGRPLMVMRPVVLVNKRAEDLAASYPRCRQVSGRGVAAVRRPQVHGPVRAMLVIVRGARLGFSCGWHITRDGQDVYSRRLK